jgi:hypothetical protein
MRATLRSVMNRVRTWARARACVCVWGGGCAAVASLVAAHRQGSGWRPRWGHSAARWVKPVVRVRLGCMRALAHACGSVGKRMCPRCSKCAAFSRSLAVPSVSACELHTPRLFVHPNRSRRCLPPPHPRPAAISPPSLLVLCATLPARHPLPLPSSSSPSPPCGFPTHPAPPPCATACPLTACPFAPTSLLAPYRPAGQHLKRPHHTVGVHDGVGTGPHRPNATPHRAGAGTGRGP